MNRATPLRSRAEPVCSRDCMVSNAAWTTFRKAKELGVAPRQSLASPHFDSPSPIIKPKHSPRLRVLELRQALDRVLSGAWEHELTVLLLQLADGDSDVVLAQADKSTGTDNGVGDRHVRRHDEVIDRPYLLILLIVDRFAEHLLLGAPA